MSSRQYVTLDELNNHQTFLKDNGISAVNAIYRELANKGYQYASWALGVATGGSITAQAALDFMNETAGRTLTEQETNNIRVAMLKGYLDAMKALVGEDGGVQTNRDVGFEATRKFHAEAFDKNGLSINNWTLETPMGLVLNYMGKEAQEKKWEEIRETGGNGPDAWFGSSTLLLFTLDVAKGFIFVDKNGDYVPSSKTGGIIGYVGRGLSIKMIDKENLELAQDWIANTQIVRALWGWGYVNKYELADDKIFTIIGDQNKDINDKLVGITDQLIVNNTRFSYHIYGLSGNDELYGNVDDDTLYGGTGNDILKGNQGNDTLIDTQGYDTYHIKDHDTIYDSDGQGKIIFSGGFFKDAPAIADTFEKVAHELWHAKDSDDKIVYMATKLGEDLLVTSLQDNDNKVTLKDFFKLATYQNETLSFLNINIKEPNTPSNPPPILDLYTNPDYTANVYTGGITPITIDKLTRLPKIYTSDKGDNIFASGKQAYDINSSKGNDLIFAGSEADIIRGGEGHDVIHGSSAFLENQPIDDQPKADNDTIYGGQGNDLIFGGVGNDVIYADDNYNPALVNSTEQGDWVVGGVGHDIIFGSQRKDFLQGGKNDDTIFGGSSDDVILGDGHVRFGQKSKTVGFRG